MSPYYDQPRHRESEDIAGGLVLLSCAVVAFVWYIAVSRLHLHNSQCLEIFLYSAVALFGGGLVFAQLVGRHASISRKQHLALEPLPKRIEFN